MQDSVLWQLIGEKSEKDIMVSQSQPLLSDGKLVLLALVGGMAAFALVLVFVSEGSVRQVEIFLPEKTYATVAFRNTDGNISLVGIGTISGVNPTILMRTGDFAMELTVVNQDSERHALYIDGLHISTRFLDPGQSEVLTFYSKNEGTYNYYDYDKQDDPLGQIQAVKVTMYE